MIDLTHLTIPASATIEDALRAIDKGACGIALVVSESDELIGLITDGDIRRAIIAGADLDEEVNVRTANRRFVSVAHGTPRAAVIDLMRARRINQIPVVDEDGRLRGLHLLHELIGAAPRPNWAVLMAGGRGTRLRPLTDAIPKPMLPVAGRPILERLIHHLVGYGITRIFLSVNHLAHLIEDHFGDGSDFGCHIEYLREETALGTGGPLRLLPDKPRDPILVMNGDLVTEANVGRMIDEHTESDSVATIGLRPYQITVPFGVAAIADGHLVSLEEKPTHEHLISAGIYVIDPDVIDRIPPNVNYPITEVLQTVLASGAAVGAHIIDDEWTDVGQRRELDEARGEL